MLGFLGWEHQNGESPEFSNDTVVKIVAVFNDILATGRGGDRILLEAFFGQTLVVTEQVVGMYICGR